jgi:phenylalanyl-tRNA synthetase beta chain
MRVPISWLKDFVEITIPIEELAHRLTLAGLEVAKVEYVGLPAEEGYVGEADHLVWDREKIVVGHILEVKAHPDADRLILALVESGIGEVETVVTGAPNLYPYKDQGPLDPPLVAPYARERAEVIDGHKDDGSRLVIKERKLRGIPNKSMVCSEKELGISDEHEGIMVIESDAPPGTPLQDVLGDVVLHLDLTPNLARCFSILGVAREVAALTGQQVRQPSYEVVAEGPPIEGQIGIEIREPDLNPRFTLALIKGIQIGPSPEQVQRRLTLAGMRPINNIVDATNYVMLEIGQPLHAFDYDKLVARAKESGHDTPTIITHLPDQGDKITTLDDIERELDDFTIMVADTAGIHSIGGIMGGALTEVSDETVNVLLEAAAWNYINIRKTLGAQRERGGEISSEAGARFSRGVHPEMSIRGVRRGIEFMRQWAGGTIGKGIIDDNPKPMPVVTVDLPIAEVERIVGIPFTASEVSDILTGLEFEVELLNSENVRVTAPNHRMDIGLPSDSEHADIAESVAQADLIEEVARIYGYDKIPNSEMADLLPPQRANVRLEREERVRDLLVRAGLQEVITYRLTTPEREALLTPAGAASHRMEAPYVQLKNPTTQDKVAMRHSLLAGMLDILAQNIVGKIYLPVEGEPLPDEPPQLCIVMTGPRDMPDWQEVGATGEMDFYDLKGVAASMMDSLHVADVQYAPIEHNTYHPGRAASVSVGGKAVGTLGELHPLVREAFGLPDQAVLVAEIDLSTLLPLVPAGHEVREISRYEAIYQDVAVVVDEATQAADVEAIIWEAGGYLLRGVRLFDVYQGEQIPAGKKSLAYALTFQSDEKTLRDKDAAKVQGRIVKALEKRLGAMLRA